MANNVRKKGGRSKSISKIKNEFVVDENDQIAEAAENEENEENDEKEMDDSDDNG